MRSLAILSLVLAAGGAVAQTQPWQSIGRAPTPDEVRAWDIDVRPDFKGLPKGSGSVALGEKIWEAQCASCHGSFGESNEVFTPIVGGTTKADIERGRVKNLEPGSGFAQRTTLMKVATVSTLWDYINRAMPWNAPKSLNPDEVYGALAYILHMGDIVPADFTLSDQNMAEVQKRMPNRNGMVFHEPLWKVSGKGDVANVACMKDCPTEAQVRSSLPDFARDAHGNIQTQNRVVGPVRGADTTRAPLGAAVGGGTPASTSAPIAVAAATAPAAAAGAGAVDVKALLSANGCTACHGMTNKIVGPGFSEVVTRHKGRADIEAYLVSRIRGGGAGTYGPVPMPPQPQLKDVEAQAIARWIASGGR